MLHILENAIQPVIMAKPSVLETYFPIQLIVQVFIIGIICGAGIPCLYALGLRMYSFTTRNASTQDSAIILGAKTISYILFAICAALVLAGIFLITAPSVEHIFHTKL